MATICFYQDTRHEKPLFWIREKFSIGYVSRRKDGITEIRINGFEQVFRILNKLLPYLRFKKPQAEIICRLCAILIRKPVARLTLPEKEKICQGLVQIQKYNYATHKKRTLNEFRSTVGLTP